LSGTVAVRKHPQSSQRSGRFHTPAAPRAALGTATRLASIKVMQRTFNPWNRERYPGGPPAPSAQSPIADGQ